MNIVKPESLLEKLLEIRASGKMRKGVSTGFESIDEYMLLNKKYLFLLTGFPNYGKSEFLDALAVNNAIMHKWKWLFFSTENDDYTTHLRKIVSKKIGTNLAACKESDIIAETQWANEYFSWVNPGEKLMSIDDVIQGATDRIESGEEIDVLVIDPWNELNHLNQQKRDDQYISDCMLKVRRFHKKYNVLSVIVIHPRSVEKNKDGTYPIPHLRDCAGGAMWWNKADYGVCVHRKDFSVHGAHIYIQKVKDSTIGRQGATFLDYDVPSGRFKDKNSPVFTIPVPTIDLPDMSIKVVDAMPALPF